MASRLPTGRSKNPIVILSLRLTVRIPKMASLMPVEALELVSEGEGRQPEGVASIKVDLPP